MYLVCVRWCDSAKDVFLIIEDDLLIAKTTFWSLMDLAVSDLSREDAGWFARTLCWLASNWVSVYVRSTPKNVFWTFSPRWLRTLALQRTSSAKKSRLCSETMPFTFFAWIAPYISWFHQIVTLLPLIIHHNESFLSTYPSSR